MLVVGTATAVGVTLANDRRLAPALADGAPVSHTAAPSALRVPTASAFDIRAMVARWFIAALAIGVAFIAIVAAAPALTTFAATRGSGTAEMQGPPAGIRAGAAAGGSWERSWSLAVPPAGELGAAVLAARQHEQDMEVVRALLTLAEEKRVSEAKAARTQRAFAGGAPTSLNRASGYAPGTVLRARITVYGCTGPGGGFCGGMASGIKVFEGAAACSYDMPFGTKLRIIGDPTGRIYECLDRGALSAPWVDVFFNNTSEGIAWASLLGGTISDIEIVN